MFCLAIYRYPGVLSWIPLGVPPGSRRTLVSPPSSKGVASCQNCASVAYPVDPLSGEHHANGPWTPFRVYHRPLGKVLCDRVLGSSAEVADLTRSSNCDLDCRLLQHKVGMRISIVWIRHLAPPLLRKASDRRDDHSGSSEVSKITLWSVHWSSPWMVNIELDLRRIGPRNGI
jgi:hypothetical protein